MLLPDPLAVRHRTTAARPASSPARAPLLPLLLLLVLPLLALLRPASAAAQSVPASAFGPELEDLHGWVLGRLQSHGRAGENADILDTFRAQRDRGLITAAQYDEAVAMLGGAPLTRGGRPFTGVVHQASKRSSRGWSRMEAELDGGRLTRVVYRKGKGEPTREIVIDDGVIRETTYWGRPFAGEPRSVTVYRDEYMGAATTRLYTPSGDLMEEVLPEGGVRYGDGWIGGLNMWNEDTEFYARVDDCRPGKLRVNGSWYAVLGPRPGGCAVEYGHWATPDPTRPRMAGTSMVCVHSGGSAYDFVNALHRQTLPNESCEGSLADLLRR